MLSEAKHLFWISNVVNFVKGDRGATCHSKHAVLACHDSLPPIPLKSPKPPHASSMCVALAYVMLHSASSMLKREHRRARCGWEDRIMSNGESKIAIFKAALCCGFAIALRALFLGILPYSPSLAEGARGWVIASEPIGRAWQPTGKESP